MKKATLITGASGGLGLEFAKLFARDGHDLVLVARSEGKLYAIKNKLENRYPIHVYVCAQDLSEKDAAYEVFDFTMEEELFIDYLVNNAGFGDFGKFSESDLQKQTDMVNVNITALMEMCHLFLNPMLEKGEGHILNLCSIAGFEPGPLMSVYYATKAFVLSFTQALAKELEGTGVSITALCPGPTKTGFEAHANLGSSGLFKNLKNASASSVAKYGYQQLKSGKTVVVPGAVNKVIAFAAPRLPKKFVRNFVYNLQKQK